MSCNAIANIPGCPLTLDAERHVQSATDSKLHQRALKPLALLLILIPWCAPQTSSVIAECLQLNSMLHGAKMLSFKCKALPY